MEQSEANNQVPPRSKNSSSGFWEMAIIAILVFLILATLNYFRILPLSDTFPFLSFLPQKAQNLRQQGITRTSTPLSSRNRVLTLQQVIAPTDPQTFNNTTEKYSRSPVKNSGLRVENDLQIDIEMIFEPSKQLKASESAGFMFDNELKDNDPNLKRLFLFYFTKCKCWILSFKNVGGKDEYSPTILRVSGNVLYGKFSLRISADGRTVIITPQGGKEVTFKLSDSIYSVKKTMSARVLLSPNSELTISSLSYQY